MSLFKDSKLNQEVEEYIAPPKKETKHGKYKDIEKRREYKRQWAQQFRKDWKAAGELADRDIAIEDAIEKELEEFTRHLDTDVV